MIRFLQKGIYRLIRKHRIGRITGLLDKEGKTLLDVGCEDLSFYNSIKNRYETTLVDISPHNKLIKKGDAQNLDFGDKSFDIVLCQEVLEHLPDPVKAISELKRVTKKQLIITVPNEPFFSLFRFFNWDKEHLWAISPELLKIHLGKPKQETTFFFKRYYVGVWKFDGERKQNC